MEDKVSVIVPAYNCEKYISDCLDSVLNQTYQNWELIIVNDKSPDSSADIILKYVENDSRIMLLNNKTNMGAASSRNKGIQNSTGRYIAFLDSDDMWKPTKLERQVEFMKTNNYGFTFTGYDMFYESGKKNKYVSVPKVVDYKMFLKDSIIGNLTVIMDKNIVGEVVIETGYLEDTITWLKYLKKGFKAYGLNENLASYRVSNVSVSSNKIKNSQRRFRILRDRENLPFFLSIYYHSLYIYHAIKKRLI
ncbi:MAG: glycosyltransferase [Candidatus Paracaedibacteraceae bacterium]|nr:glycosyltransferase [Candidatus Paracaedibacteraceae bacterium]